MGHDYPQHDQPADTARIGRHHRETFAKIPEWVALADIPPQALALYVRLHIHVNRERGDGVVWPGMEALAKMMGYQRRQSLRPHLAALAEIGALDIIREEGNLGRRNVYVVHSLPRDDHEGPRSLAEFYKERHAERDARMGAVPPMRMDAAPHERMGGVATMNQTNHNQTKVTRGSTPPGEDDCASSGQKRVSDLMLKKPKRYASLTREQAAQALVAVYAAALDARGVTVTEDAKDRVGASLRMAFDEGRSHAWVWDGFRRLLDDTWRGKVDHPWLIAPRPSSAGTRAA